MTKGSVLISDCAFWRRGYGEPLRQRELLRYLAGLGPVDLMYFGGSFGEYEQLTSRLMFGRTLSNVRCHMMRPFMTFDANLDAMLGLMNVSLPKRIIVTSTALSWVSQCVAEDVVTMIDGDAANIPACLTIPEIVKQVDQFDVALFSRQSDYDNARNVLSSAQCVWAPTPISQRDEEPVDQSLNAGPWRVGVFFGPGRVNYEDIWKIRDAIWQAPQMQDKSQQIKIVVGLSDVESLALDVVREICPEFEFVHVAEDDVAFFQRLCCVYIPSMGVMSEALILEALSHLCPVVTSPQGVVGLPEAARNICTLGQRDFEIIAGILQYVGNPQVRAEAVAAIKRCAQTTLSGATCFAAIAKQVTSTEQQEADHDARPLGNVTGRENPYLPMSQDNSETPPSVCVVLQRFESLNDDWLPLTGLPGVRVLIRSYDQEMEVSRLSSPGQCGDAPCRLMITDDPDYALDVVQTTQKEVWLCSPFAPDTQHSRLRVFPNVHGIRWSVGDLAAHLAVWVRKLRAH